MSSEAMRTTREVAALPASIRFVTVAQLVKAGHARTTIWRKVKSGELPQPIKWMGRVGWREGTLKRLLDEAEAKVS